jgi:TolA-binding protein
LPPPPEPLGAAPGAIDSRPPPSTAPPPGPALSSEVALLDPARHAIAAHDPKSALAALDGYDRTFPRGALAQEATLLRIEALLQAGDRPRATTLGDTFLRGDPKGPYAKRVHEMLAR